ncbi:hypothetical protein KY290_021135 [Solanum tuberosum]|uniref:Uncharacterized protein n=1 Tax=Solanum tuberosum TaxID=4113 RepID=A0ABQ7V2P5_SOLTU|nr:hypothetical protein KY289_020306 [Solanum tuberosum]KAH0757642.1 hypothetical protein KY290_021135 [Solanum tuberosum]
MKFADEKGCTDGVKQKEIRPPFSLEELRSKLQNKEDSEMEEELQIQGDGLNSELAEEYPLHESSSPKEAYADDELDEGLGPADNAEQR